MEDKKPKRTMSDEQKKAVAAGVKEWWAKRKAAKTANVATQEATDGQCE